MAFTDFMEPSMHEIAAMRFCVAVAQFFCLDRRFWATYRLTREQTVLGERVDKDIQTRLESHGILNPRGQPITILLPETT